MGKRSASCARQRKNNQMRDLIEKYEKENSEREERLLARDKAIDDFISTWRSAAGQEKKNRGARIWRQVWHDKESRPGASKNSR